jgi:hypothetical protein
MSFKDKLNQDKVECFNKARPDDITPDQWAIARTHAEMSATKLSKEVEQSAFYFYYIGDSFEDISAKLGVSLEILVYTAIYYDWRERKDQTTSVRAGVKVTRADAAAIDLITDSIVATAALYKSKLAEVIKNPSSAKECPLIPKNFKELQTLLLMLQSLQTEKPLEGSGSGPAPAAVNINIANLTNGPNGPKQQITSDTVDVVALPPGDPMDNATMSTDEKMQILQLLERVKR